MGFIWKIRTFSKPLTKEDQTKTKCEPLILIHGGTSLSDKRRDVELQGVRTAAIAGYALLKTGYPAIDAVQIAVMNMEDNPVFNAGYGAVLNIEGKIEMDASLMEGSELTVGGIAGINNVKNPIAIARLVLEKTPHCLLSGPGLQSFIIEQRVKTIPMESLITEDIKKEFERYKKEWSTYQKDNGGTVGSVAMDCNGHVAYATSTGGLMGKMAGRVGDSSIVGLGGYADDKIGAVSCTGIGESIMKMCLAKTVISLMEKGMDPKSASVISCQKLMKRVGGNAGVITLAKDGEFGVAFNSPRMPWCAIRANELIFANTLNKLYAEKINL